MAPSINPDELAEEFAGEHNIHQGIEYLGALPETDPADLPDDLGDAEGPAETGAFGTSEQAFSGGGHE